MTDNESQKEKVRRFFDNELQQFPSTASERSIISKIRDYYYIVSELYNSPVVAERVRQVVPWQRLEKQAAEKAVALSEKTGNDTDFKREFFVVELMSWFKNEFFSWFDTGICDNESCPAFGQAMTSAGKGTPSPADLLWGGSRVELYSCSSCGSSERFVRFNHPLKLLDTRRGRCGEWANLFSCMCSVFGFETRLVLDFTDHVWTEVWSQDRWLHADSCEAGLDSPLVYESGWGKRLSYCFAVNGLQVQDVSWRYISLWTHALTRRSLCSESWLCLFLIRLNDCLQSHLPSDQRIRLQERTVRELATLLHVPWNQSPAPGEYQGRQSGSQAWRQARNEMGNTTAKSEEKHVFLVTRDQESNQYLMSFNCVSQEYCVNGKRERMGWASGSYSWSHVCRKVEHDWHMVYLCRTEGSDPQTIGSVTWAFELENEDWTRICIRIQGLQVNDATLSLRLIACHSLSSDDQLILSDLTLDQELVVTRSQVPMDRTFLLIQGKMSGGSESLAWQKAQLFRQSFIHDRNLSTFTFRVDYSSV